MLNLFQALPVCKTSHFPFTVFPFLHFAALHFSLPQTSLFRFKLFLFFAAAAVLPVVLLPK